MTSLLAPKLKVPVLRWKEDALCRVESMQNKPDEGIELMERGWCARAESKYAEAHRTGQKRLSTVAFEGKQHHHGDPRFVRAGADFVPCHIQRTGLIHGERLPVVRVVIAAVRRAT